MSEQIDPEIELERLKTLPVQERPRPVEELVQRLEQELEEKSPRPPTKP